MLQWLLMSNFWTNFECVCVRKKSITYENYHSCTHTLVIVMRLHIECNFSLAFFFFNCHSPPFIINHPETVIAVITWHGHVAVSSQGIQDHLGAKSPNWLAVLSTSFSISPREEEPLNESGSLPCIADKMEKDCNWFAFYLIESMKYWLSSSLELR